MNKLEGMVTFKMSPNHRIFLNIIATYGWNLYALVCGLLICRSVLAAVGKSEFGVCGVVGGMMVIELLAGTMRLDRISPEAIGRAAKRALAGCGIAAGEMRGERNGECDYIRNV